MELSIGQSDGQTRFLPMTKNLPANFAPREQVIKSVVSIILDKHHDEFIATTIGLYGTGGFGKTTLAIELCKEKRIIDTFHDGFLWVTLGQNPGPLVEKVNNLIKFMSLENPGFTDIEEATTYFQELLDDRYILLVIDDVWDESHLEPFLREGRNCTRLITTREEKSLPTAVERIQVGAMTEPEALALLSDRLNGEVHTAQNTQALRRLANRLGKWPLLLKLVKSELLDRLRHGESLPRALTTINTILDKQGIISFDASDPVERYQAIEMTLKVSFDRLKREEYPRYQELAIFPENTDIPFATVQKLWGTLDNTDTERLCLKFDNLSLLLECDLDKRTIQMRDVLLTYLREKVGEIVLATFHQKLLNTYQYPHWAELPQDEPYLWEHLTEHLIGARRIEELIATVKDGNYLAIKICFRGVYAVETDLDIAEKQVPDDSTLRLLRRSVARISHLLYRCKTLQEIADLLYSRFSPIPELNNTCVTLAQDLSHPLLTSYKEFLDLSHPALIRTLQKHNNPVRGCAITSTGDYIISASYDTTLKVWTSQTGFDYYTLTGHTSAVNGCSVSFSSDLIISASSDMTLKIWDLQIGAIDLTLNGHTAEVYGCAVSPDGDWIVSASADATLKVWDTLTGAELRTLAGHIDAVNGCAVSPNGDWIVSASFDKTLKIWDALTGVELQSLIGHTGGAYRCAVSPSGEWIVSASDDTTLKVWDIQIEVKYPSPSVFTDGVNGCIVSKRGDFVAIASGQTVKVWDPQLDKEYFTLSGHSDLVKACSVSPTGNSIISASNDWTLKIWDAQKGIELRSLIGHSSGVNGCAMSPDGNWIVSASDDKTLKVWDSQKGTEMISLLGHTDWVRACAISPTGDYIVSASYDRTLKIWDAHTGAERLTLIGHHGNVTGCAVSPTGEWIVSVSIDKTIRLWNVLTGNCLTTLIVDEELQACVFYPDGIHLVAGGERNIFFLQIKQ